MSHTIEGCLIKYNTFMFNGKKVLPGAFKDSNNLCIPACKNFDFYDLSTVIGHATLKEKPDGIYYIVETNEMPDVDTVIDLIKYNGFRFGMFANKLKQNNFGEIEYGVIRAMGLTAPCDVAACIISVDGEDVLESQKDTDQLTKRITELQMKIDKTREQIRKKAEKLERLNQKLFDAKLSLDDIDE